jgi:hypothetical protein
MERIEYNRNRTRVPQAGREHKARNLSAPNTRCHYSASGSGISNIVLATTSVHERRHEGSVTVDCRRLTKCSTIATKRSNHNADPPAIISACMVPLRLKVARLRMMRAR